MIKMISMIRGVVVLVYAGSSEGLGLRFYAVGVCREQYSKRSGVKIQGCLGLGLRVNV